MRLLLHIALAAGVMYWIDVERVDPLICFAVYAFGVVLIDGPRRLPV